MIKQIKLHKLTLTLLGLFAISCSTDDDVENVNGVPVAQNLTMTIDDGVPAEIELAATDSDYDPLTFKIVDEPTLGTVVISGNKATYTPNDNADGADSFSYVANDGTTDSNKATVTVTVNGSFVLSGTYTTNKTLTADKIWSLNGRVFIAVKLTGNNVLSATTKESIKNSILKRVNVVTVEPIIIDPVFFYLIIDSTVNYDPVTNLTDEDTLKTNINTSIQSYLQTNLEKFDQKFRHSQLVQDIDNTNDSIRNNKTLIKYQQRIAPETFNVPQTYILNFNNELEKGSVTSTSFTGTDGNTYSLVDDSNGYIKAAKTTSGVVDTPKEYLIQPDGSTNQGQIYYDTGKIKLNSLRPLAITDSSTSIRLNVTPELNNSDITPLRDQIITYDSNEVSSITINMVAETII